MNFLLDVPQLLHQVLVDVQASCGIEDDDVVAVVLGVFNGVFGDLHRADGAHLKDGCIHLGTNYLQLFNRCRAVDVAGYQQWTVTLLAKHLGQFGRMGGFTGTLQAAHHDDGWNLGGKVDAAVGGTHQLGQLVANNLDDLLGRSEAGKHLFADGFFSHILDKVFGNLVVDVRFQQGHSDLAHRVPDVVFGKLTFGAQLFKGLVELIGKSLECHRTIPPLQVKCSRCGISIKRK